MEKEVISDCGDSSVKDQQQIKEEKKKKKKKKKTQLLDERTSADEQQPVLIHGLSVERYREIYHSVLTPSVLAGLSTAKAADYVSQVLELKQRLWVELSRPQLQETVGQDGRVEVKEIFDLT